MNATHLAGNAIVIGDRIIQRCFICGLKLADNRGAMAPVGEDGKAPVFPTWPTGAWVEVTEGNPTAYIVVGESESPTMDTTDVPPNCCLERIDKALINPPDDDE